MCLERVARVVVEVGTILSFKKTSLDSYMGTMGIEGYGAKRGQLGRA